MLTSVSNRPATLFTVITYGTSCPRVTLSSGVVLEIAIEPVELRIERDVVVEDLARARHLAAVQPQVDVVDRAGAACRNRCSRRELRRLHFADTAAVPGIASSALPGQAGTENAAVEASDVGGMICE